MEKNIKKWVLQNSFQFGSVNPKFVMGMVLKENNELKKDLPKLMKEIETTIKENSQLSNEEIKKQLQELAPELLKKKKPGVKGPLKPLPQAEKGKVIVRIAPSPSGPLHIGHAYGASLNYEYAKMYQGKFLVRIEDTNPENIYEPAYNLIEDDANWLTNKQITEVIIQSSRLGTYYDYAEKLIELNKAYVCTCNPDQWRELKNQGTACPCRKLPKKENQLHYAKMFNEYATGEAVLRLKTEIDHKNPAMRDFVILRINEHIHPKTGKEQRVWPLMVFSVAIDDHELGITHVLNGKDHTDNGKKEALIMNYLSWKPPIYQHWGRINFEGFKLSTTKTKLAIEQNEYTGWDDIRLMTLLALRKRGYQAGAFRKYATEIGLSSNDKTVTLEEFWKNINAFNKDIIEPQANRYFFVQDPIKIKINNLPKKEVKLDLHPDFPKRGQRTLDSNGEINIGENDLNKLSEGKIHRLMDYCNFEVKDGKYQYVSEIYEDYKSAKSKGRIIHWLPDEKNIVVNVVLEDNNTALGLGEENMKNLKEGDLVQLERNYFARVDKKEKNKIVFWYLHK